MKMKNETKEKLNEARAKIRDLKSELFKALDYEDINTLKAKVLEVLRQL